MLLAGVCGPFEVLSLKAVLIIVVFQFHAARPANGFPLAQGGVINPPPKMLCGSSAALTTIFV